LGWNSTPCLRTFYICIIFRILVRAYTYIYTYKCMCACVKNNNNIIIISHAVWRGINVYDTKSGKKRWTKTADAHAIDHKGVTVSTLIGREIHCFHGDVSFSPRLAPFFSRRFIYSVRTRTAITSTPRDDDNSDSKQSIR
jgi:hypothetical protein